MIKDTDDLLYTSNTKMIIELLDKWSKAKPNNKELVAVIEAFWEITTYVGRLRVQEQDGRIAVSDAKYMTNLTKLKIKEIQEIFNTYQV